jgi:hypothetical protein
MCQLQLNTCTPLPPHLFQVTPLSRLYHLSYNSRTHAHTNYNTCVCVNPASVTQLHTLLHPTHTSNSKIISRYLPTPPPPQCPFVTATPHTVNHFKLYSSYITSIKYYSNYSSLVHTLCVSFSVNVSSRAFDLCVLSRSSMILVHLHSVSSVTPVPHLHSTDSDISASVLSPFPSSSA